MPSHIANPQLADTGKKDIQWAAQQMPVLADINNRFKKEKPLKGLTIAACLHVTTETANLMLAIKNGGADVHLCASNPLSTQDSTAAALVKYYDIPVYAIHGEDRDTYYRHIKQALDTRPHITMDDGADLANELHQHRQKQLTNMIGSTEETTTGVIRLQAMAADGALKLPVIAVNSSLTKHLFDNRYGTGQSTIDGIIRATNILIAGKTIVVSGYGWCGRGIASRAKGHGAHVIITEVDPIKALEATMDGFPVMPMMQAVKVGHIFISSTGDKHVIHLQAIQAMKHGAIMAQSGHFDVEIDITGLQTVTKKVTNIRPSLDEYLLKDGTKRYLLGEGRLINLAAAEGHPAEVMDMSFANQALAAEYLAKNKGKLSNQVHKLPDKIDHQIATLKLQTMGVKIDKLTKQQKKYLSSWEEGT
jgi:adenosylhomocysteinase